MIEDELTRCVIEGKSDSEMIGNGEVDLNTPGLQEHLWQTTLAKLAVDQPSYASYKREVGREEK